MINRDYDNYDSSTKKYKGTGNGEVIRVTSGVTLDVVGSTANNSTEAATKHGGTKIEDGSAQGQTGTFWKYSKDGSDVITGGLITGGGCDDHLGGGGFTVQANATLNLTNVTVAGNVADTYGATYGCGGGIASGGTVNLDASTVEYNHANGWGGGIYLDLKAGLFMRNGSSVSNNRAVKRGGGVAFDPSSTKLLYLPVRLYDSSKIDYNITDGNGGGLYVGGHAASGIMLTLSSNSEISHNAANGNGGGIAYDQENGSGSFYLRDSKIEYNLSGGKGGGIWFSCDELPLGETSDDPGYHNDEYMFNVSISHNKAKGDGGAIAFDETAIWHGRTVWLGSKVTYEGNETEGAGGAIAFISRIDVDTVSIGGGTVFKNNKAKGDGGAIWLGSPMNLTNYTTGDDGRGEIQEGGYGDITFDGNESADGYGGALFSKDNSATIDLFGSHTTKFTNNKAKSGGALYVRGQGSSYYLNVDNAEFTGNQATAGSGGAIWIDKGLTIKNTSITGNSATDNGGGVYNCNSSYYDFTLKGKVLIDGNKKGSDNNNLSLKGDQTVCGGLGDDALTADSKIGVTIEDYDYHKRRITGNQAFVTAQINDSWPSCVYSDNTDYRVFRDGNYLYLHNVKTSEYGLTIISADASGDGTGTKSESKTCEAFSTVTLKSSDYAKKTKQGDTTADWTLASWTLTMSGETKTLEPQDGETSFELTGPATIRANYVRDVKSVDIKLGDVYSYDKIAPSDDPESGDTPVVKTSLSLAGVDGTGVKLENDKVNNALKVTKREVAEVEDDHKTVTYTLQIAKSAFTDNNMAVPTDSTNLGFRFTSSFSKYAPEGETVVGDFSSTEVSNFEVLDDAVQFKVSVEVPHASKAYTVTLVANKSSIPGDWHSRSSAIDLYGKFTDGNQTKDISTSAGDVINFDEVETPTVKNDSASTKEKFTFVGWANEDGTLWDYETPVTSNTKLYAAYVDSYGKCVVTYKDSKGGILANQVVETGKTTTQPTNISKVGQTLKGYYADKDYKTEFNFDSTKIENDTTVYVKFDHDTCKVTFDLAGGIKKSGDTQATVEYGKTIKATQAPKVTKTGYYLIGWYLNDDEYDFDTPVTSNITLTAVWGIDYNDVVFVTGEGAPEVPTQTVEYNDYAIQPTDPTWDGHIFKGWYKDENFTDEFDFTTKITAATKVYAKWADAYTVTLKYQDGATADELLTIEKDSKLGILPTPSRAHYTFAGWYDGTGKQATSDTTVTKNMTLFANWTTNKYWVNYYNGARLLYAEHVEYGKTPNKDSAAKYEEKTGYTFNGWKLADGTDFDFTKAVEGDVNVYGSWNVKQFEVTFETGEGSAVESQTVDYGKGVTKPADPTLDGYEFDGWYADATCTKEFDFDATAIKKNTTIYAKWTQLVTVKFTGLDGAKLADGSALPVTKTVRKGSALGVLPEASKKGCIFQGWVNVKDTTIVTADTTFDQDTELVAMLTETVGPTVKLMDGSTVWAITSTDDSGKVKLPADPTKAGYKFEGWYTQQDGGEKWDKDATITTDLTLHARWTATKCKVTFKNGPETLNEQEVQFGKTAAKPEITVPDGFTFDGWYKDAEFNDEFDFTAPITEDTTVYAKFDQKVEKVIVKFDSCGGSDVVDQTIVKGSALESLPEPTRENCTFDGWYDNKDYSGEKVTKTTTFDKNTTLYAKWTEKIVSLRPVSFFVDGTREAFEAVKVGDPIVDPGISVPEGKELDGWYDNADCTGEKFDLSKPLGIGDNLSLYAKLKTQTFTVTFDTKGGSPVPEKQTVDYGTKVNKPTTDPKRTDYTFTGWYADEDCTTLFDFENNQITAATTIYAGWNAISEKVTITFDSCEGSAVGPQEIEKGSALTTLPIPTRDNYTFEGWYDNKDYKGDKIAEATTFDKNTTLYAKWSENKPGVYVVTFKTNGAYQGDFTQEVKEDEKVEEPNIKLTKKGYTFTGWFADEKCTEEFEFGNTVSKNTTVYAGWKEDEPTPEPTAYTVTFDTDGGSEVASQSVEEGSKATKPADPTRDGYTFKGWFTNKNYDTEFDFENTPITSKTTIYAKWEENEQPAPEPEPTPEPEPATYTVTFETGIDIKIDAVQVKAGEKVSAPDVSLTAKGYTFAGWYTDKTCTTKFDFDTPINADTTLYAGWLKNGEDAPTPSPDEKKDESKGKTIPQTGDNALIAVCAAGAAGIAAVAGGFATRRRKE